ncbi:hypothetical protein CTI12_AA302420 [Artemisia annua]|uniref:SWIM-type domain-containing protein n=1 Tax=Artemisia annua TaxID=35608 RepID=A0A2U1N5F1_ARTAN|nr:hypothetical protein CTI12_AA302420 [Artemisia annua]
MASTAPKFKLHLQYEGKVYGVLLPNFINFSQLQRYVKKKFMINRNKYGITLSYISGSKTVYLIDEDDVAFFKNEIFGSTDVLKLFVEAFMFATQNGVTELPHYCYNLELENEGTVTAIDTDDEGIFKVVFVAFGIAMRLKTSLLTRPLQRVWENQKSHVVVLRESTCTCRKWQLSGLSCGHVYALSRFLGLSNCNQRAKYWFKKTTLKGTYEGKMYPLKEMKMWSTPGDLQVVKPPYIVKRQSGRPKDNKRILSQGEEPRRYSCGRCGVVGHTRANCNMALVNKKRPSSPHTNVQSQPNPSNPNMFSREADAHYPDMNFQSQPNPEFPGMMSRKSSALVFEVWHKGVFYYHPDLSYVGEEEIWSWFYCIPTTKLEIGLTIVESDNDVKRMYEMAEMYGSLEFYVSHDPQLPLVNWYYKNVCLVKTDEEEKAMLNTHEKRLEDWKTMMLDVLVAWEEKECQSPYLRSPPLRRTNAIRQFKGKVLCYDNTLEDVDGFVGKKNVNDGVLADGYEKDLASAVDVVGCVVLLDNGVPFYDSRLGAAIDNVDIDNGLIDEGGSSAKKRRGLGNSKLGKYRNKRVVLKRSNVGKVTGGVRKNKECGGLIRFGNSGPLYKMNDDKLSMIIHDHEQSFHDPYPATSATKDGANMSK